MQNSQKFCRSLFFHKVTGWKPETVRSSYWKSSVKTGVLKKFANFTGKSLCWSLFLIKLQFWGPATLLKKTPTQVLSCEICKLFKSNNFEEHLWVFASKGTATQVFSREFNELFKSTYFVEDLQTAGSEFPVLGFSL